MHSLKKKYVLCRPQGGLNDILCQIELCWRYAERSGRTLVIDANRSALSAQFSSFFDPLSNPDDVIFDPSKPFLKALNSSSCFPEALNGRLLVYSSEYSAAHNHIDSISRTPLTFDFSKTYQETVLLHDQAGGGRASLQALAKLRLSDELSKFILQKLKGIPQNYDAVHIRNTDYKTNYKFLIKKIARRLDGRPLLICSDDPNAIEFSRSSLGNTEVFTVSELPQVNGLPLHASDTFRSCEARVDAARSSVVDLLALSNATNFYYTDIRDGFPSGFSRLAAGLCDDRRTVRSLMGAVDLDLNLRRGGKSHYIRPISSKLRKIIPKIIRSSIPGRLH